ncbi:hypothetical protein CYMTET_18164, partial [Cymbomonas tetramitiformis]
EREALEHSDSMRVELVKSIEVGNGCTWHRSQQPSGMGRWYTKGGRRTYVTPCGKSLTGKEAHTAYNKDKASGGSKSISPQATGKSKKGPSKRRKR